MFHRSLFGGSLEDSRIIRSASQLKLDITRDASGEVEISWQLHGCVIPSKEDDDDCYFHATNDTQLVETMVGMFTQRRDGGDQ